MASFGPALQLERQRRGLSLDDVARETRLASRYLLALEDESLDRLPGKPYNRSYVRIYAEYLGLDADRLVRDYDLEVSAQSEAGRLAVAPDALATMRVAAQHRAPQIPAGRTAVATRVRVSALSGVLIVALVAAMWMGAGYFRQSTEPAPVDASGPPEPVGSGGCPQRSLGCPDQRRSLSQLGPVRTRDRTTFRRRPCQWTAPGWGLTSSIDSSSDGPTRSSSVRASPFGRG